MQPDEIIKGVAAAWLPLLQTLAGGVIAGGVALYVNHRSHKNALEREEKAAAERLRNERQAAEEKLARERYFIATELVFLLEQFAEKCAHVAVDTGVNEHQHRIFSTESPLFNIENVSGDWRALPPLLMYRILQLPVMQSDAEDAVAFIKARDSSFQKFRTFHERHYQYARLGLKAAILAIKLRASANLPASLIRKNAWSPFLVLRTIWKQERKRKTQEFRERQRNLAVFAIKNDMKTKALDHGADSGEKG